MPSSGTYPPIRPPQSASAPTTSSVGSSIIGPISHESLTDVKPASPTGQHAHNVADHLDFDATSIPSAGDVVTAVPDPDSGIIGASWAPGPSSNADHGLLSGLGDDDHPQYARANHGHQLADLFGFYLVRRTTDSANKTNNTLANDTVLLWNTGANDVYHFEGFLIFNAANATMDCQVGWSVPSGTTMKWGTLGNGTGVPFGYSVEGTASTPTVMAIQSGAMAAGSAVGDFGIFVTGIVTCSTTAGTVTMQWAQNTTDAGVLKLLTNSFLRVWRLA